jgi:xylan 1,4-beta-xylosidase
VNSVLRRPAIRLSAALKKAVSVSVSGALLFISTSSLQAAQLAPATVVMDHGVTVSETGRDDLNAARDLFKSASFPESNGGLESSWPLLSRLNMRAVRLINTEGHSRLDGAGNLVPSDRTGWFLPWVKRYSLTPHIVVGQWHPDGFSAPASQWDGATWARYEDYAYKYIRFVAAEFDGTGFWSSFFEVGNEVDITQTPADLWTLGNPNVAQGAEARYEHYMKVYRVWSRAAARVAAENPQRTVQIGGPAMGGQSLFLTNSFWHERFVNDVANEGLRLDVLTHHFYGDVYNGWNNVPGSGLRTQLNRMRSALNARGRNDTQIAITEWGATEAADGQFGAINYRHQGAAWGMAFVTEAIAGTATSGSFLGTRDNMGADDSGPAAFASLLHRKNGVEFPKPIANALQMWWMMPGTRKEITTPADRPNVRAVASSGGEGAAMIVYNYNYKFAPGWYHDEATDETVVPGFTGLPFNGDVVVLRYVIDQSRSNLAIYLDGGLAPQMRQAQLERVETCYAQVVNGSLVLPARSLSPSAVSLWVLRAIPASPAYAPYACS